MAAAAAEPAGIVGTGGMAAQAVILPAVAARVEMAAAAAAAAAGPPQAVEQEMVG
jgi:hypothetical protein